MNNLKIFIISILSYLAISYQGISFDSNAGYVWIDTFTDAFNGFGITTLITIIAIFIFYKYKDNIKLNKQDNNFIVLTSILLAILMGIGKYFQYKVSSDTFNLLTFQIIYSLVVMVGYFFLFKKLFCYLLLLLKKDNFKYNKTFNKLNNLIFEKHPYLCVIIIILICYLPYLTAFFPSVFPYDGSYQIAQYLGGIGKNDHHPIFIMILFGKIAYLYQKYNQIWFLFLYPIINLSLLMIGILLLQKLMCKLNTPYLYRYFILAFYCFLTYFPQFTMTTIKDSIYYPCFMVYCILIISIILDYKEFIHDKLLLLIFIGFTSLMLLSRYNGIIVFIITSLFVILIAKQYRLKLSALFIIIFVIYYGISQYCYSTGISKDDFKEDTYTVMLQQTANYVLQHGDDVTAQEKEVLADIFEYDELPYKYNPRNADYVKSMLRIEGGYVLETRFDEYKQVWLAQLLRHPVSYISAFIQSSYGYWYPDIEEVYEGLGYYHSLKPSDSFEFEDLTLFQSGRDLLEKVAYTLRDIPVIGLFYSQGFYAFILITIFIYFITHKNYKYLITTIPYILNLAICCVSPVSGYVRYAMPVIAATPALVILFISYVTEGYRYEKNK